MIISSVFNSMPNTDVSRNGRQQSVLNALLEDMFSGGVAGIVGKTATAPFERVKLILQVQRESSQIRTAERYKGFTDCFVRVYQEQGLLSFWRGNTANVMRYIPSQALNFSLRDRYREFFLAGVPKTDFWRYFGLSLVSGGATGGTSLAVLYPFDFARTLVGTDVGTGAGRLYSGSIDCLRQAFSQGGMRGIYKGFDVSLIGIVAWRGLYFGTYDVATEYILGDRRGGTLMQRWGLAQLVTSVAGTAVYPMDTIRRRMMMQMQLGRNSVSRGVYTSSWHCAKSIAKEEGFRGFFGGLSANLVRGTGGAIMLVLFDEIKSAL